MEILIGTDPEMFVMQDGRFISGHDLIPGDKRRPFHVVRGAIQVDGVACEFNTYPCTKADEFLETIRIVQEQMTEFVHKKNPEAVLVAEPTAYFDREYFDSLPLKAKLLGCEPDYNAYTGKENNPPGTNECFRTGAGHIHIGWTEGMEAFDPDHFDLCRRIVRQLDFSLYPLSLEWDSDTKRQELYGKPGSFRPKHYGVEFRPLSNAYLRSDDTVRLVFETTMKSVRDLFNGIEYNKEWRIAA